MNLRIFAASILTISAVSTALLAQDVKVRPKSTPPPMVVTTPTPTQSPKLSETLSKNLEASLQNDGVSQERREQAYAKLLEAQRYIWNISRQRGQGTSNNASNNVRLAKQALQKAVELNPN